MFYISSQGHSASAWLSKSLCVNPKIVCWHGSRSIPPYHSNNVFYKNLNKDEFVSGLEACEKNTFGNKIFGAIHGYHGTHLKNEIEKKGGGFYAIFRHPYAKINSIFSAYFPNQLTNGKLKSDEIKFDTKDLFNEIEKEINIKSNNYINKVKKKNEIKKMLEKKSLLQTAKKINAISNLFRKKLRLTGMTEIKHADKLNSYSKEDKSLAALDTFLHACIRTFETDKELNSSCDIDSCFTMEKFVSSEVYFNNLVKKISGLSMTKEQLGLIFSDKNHINLHSVKKTNNEIYDSWPNGFKDIIKIYLSDLDLKNFYEKLDYSF